MNPSLSVILPVYNAAETLGSVVGRLLDTLPDLTARFEILIVDDASTDHTAEVADDWRRAYPQVRVIRHGWSWGTSAAVRTGRLECRGDKVILVRSLDEFNPREIARQWALLNRAAADVAPLPAADAEPRLRRTEPPHDDIRRQREPSFLKHLRQLSDAR